MSITSIPREYSPTTIWLYYVRSIEALDVYQAEVIQCTEGRDTFSGLTIQEVYQELENVRNELDTEVTLALVSSFEAILRIDYSSWISRKRKGDLRKKFKELDTKYKDRVPLDEILEIWKNQIERPSTIGKFKQLVRFRHWIAHGRYWVQKSGVNPDPQMAWDVAESLFGIMPGFEDALD